MSKNEYGRRTWWTPWFVARTLREKGFVYCFKMALSTIRRQPVFKRIVWVIPAFRFLLRPRAQLEKRILAIWDFRAVPYSIGDLIMLHGMTQIWRSIHQVDKVDICFVCDPRHPVREPGEQGVTPHNFHRHFPALVSTVYLNPHVGSFFLFDSHDQLEAFVSDNADRYRIWPALGDYVTKYKTYKENIHYIQDFYQKNGFTPYLECRPAALEWAYSFYESCIRPEFPVVVHLRNNPLSDPFRNAPLDAWLEFFKACEGNFDVRFILVGALGEIDDRFRRLPNVLIAKDHQTTVEQDLVLVYTSLIFLGSPSGPGTMALLSKTPYVMFGSEKRRFNFATDMQKLTFEPETAEALMEEFSSLFNRVDKLEWEERAKRFITEGDKKTFRSHLRWAD